MNYLQLIGIIGPIILAVGFIVVVRQRDAAERQLEELYRWRTYWQESRRWLAEFPDVADALEHLHARATGAGGTDIIRTREQMRARRGMPVGKPWVDHERARAGLTAQSAAARESEHRVDYQHLSSECDGCNE